MKKFGFGPMRLPLLDQEDPKSIDLPQMEKMVDLFLERGFTYFDTAYMYHAYESEKAIREALVKRHPRGSFTLTTKLPVVFLKTKEDQERIFKEQLEKCGVDYFDYYMLHAMNGGRCGLVEKLDSFGFLRRLKEEGKVRQIGMSYHDNAQLLDEILTAHPELDFVQLQLNYLDWDNESIQSGKCYEVAAKHGKPVIVMEPVKGGTLAKVPAEAEKLFRSHRPGQSPALWAIRFAASHENVMMVLSGMTSLEQMEENSRCMQDFQPLSQEEFEVVGKAVKIINDSVAIPCTACQYCVEGCPKHIPIPKYFALYNAEKQALNKGFSTQQVYYANYASTHGKASDCVGCKQCERACPQHIHITSWLKEVAQTFEKSK